MEKKSTEKSGTFDTRTLIVVFTAPAVFFLLTLGFYPTAFTTPAFVFFQKYVSYGMLIGGFGLLVNHTPFFLKRKTERTPAGNKKLIGLVFFFLFSFFWWWWFLAQFLKML